LPAILFPELTQSNVIGLAVAELLQIVTNAVVSRHAYSLPSENCFMHVAVACNIPKRDISELKSLYCEISEVFDEY
jgi:hypothetical protein